MPLPPPRGRAWEGLECWEWTYVGGLQTQGRDGWRREKRVQRSWLKKMAEQQCFVKRLSRKKKRGKKSVAQMRIRMQTPAERRGRAWKMERSTAGGRESKRGTRGNAFAPEELLHAAMATQRTPSAPTRILDSACHRADAAHRNRIHTCVHRAATAGDTAADFGGAEGARGLDC